jgi:N utilization substance protein A
VEEVAYVTVEYLASIEGFDEAVGEELRNRANEYLKNKEAEQTKKLKALGVADDLIKFDLLTLDIVLRLAENDVKSLDDFAGLATDEFFEIVPKSMLNGLTRDEVESTIMKLREKWF